MEEVAVGEKRLADYRDIVGHGAYAEILALAETLKGKRVAHVNATSYGGGVAELLHSVIPLQSDLGLDVRWFLLAGQKPFFEVTKTIHNGLQGGDVSFTDEERATYRHVNEQNASTFADEFDYVVIHDPQPAPFANLVERRGKWIWRCHIDLTSPNLQALGMIAPHIQAYDACIFSSERYVPKGVPVHAPFVAPPAIDPLSPKNRPVYDEERANVQGRWGFDPDRPVMSQVGRFDPWKDPLGVIDAYRAVKEGVPDVQLLLIGSMAKDDPEGWQWFERTARHAGEDPDIHFLTDLRGVGALEVNLLQRETDVALVKSLREGFGLVVSESMWKEVPVVGGDVTGIRMQIEDGKHGFLVSSAKDAARRSLQLLKDDGMRRAMGAAGRERVRQDFLITRYVRDYLRLFRKLAA